MRVLPTTLISGMLLLGAGCGVEEVDVLVTVDVVGPVPTSTYHWIEVDSSFQRSYAFGDTLHYTMKAGTHTFHFYMVGPNCSVDPAGPVPVALRAEDSPVLVKFVYTCAATAPEVSE